MTGAGVFLSLIFGNFTGLSQALVETYMSLGVLCFVTFARASPFRIWRPDVCHRFLVQRHRN